MRSPSAGHLARPGIEREVGELQVLARAVGRPPQKCPHAREQLLERERLRQVVVRARVEALDPVLDLRPRGQHQDRQPAAVAAQRAGDLEPVDARHQHVEHHRVGLGLGLQPLECLRAVLGQFDLVAFELQRAAKRLPHGPLVVHHKDLHVRIVAPEAERGVRSACTSRALRDFLGNLHAALRLGVWNQRRHRSRDPPNPLCVTGGPRSGASGFLTDFLPPSQRCLRGRWCHGGTTSTNSPKKGHPP